MDRNLVKRNVRALARAFCLAILAFLVCAPVFAEEPRVYFSPGGGAEAALEKLVDGARENIRIAVYTFTSRPLSQALARAAKRGVKVEVILDGNDVSEFSKGVFLAKRGVEVRYARGMLKKFGSGKKSRKKQDYGLMHHKFMVVDGRRLATGSYNWTASAENWNRENLLVFDSPGLASKFMDEFRAIWKGTMN